MKTALYALTQAASIYSIENDDTKSQMPAWYLAGASDVWHTIQKANSKNDMTF